MEEIAEPIRTATPPRPSRAFVRSWIAAVLLPVSCLAATALRGSGEASAAPDAAVPHHTTPITGTVATVADCGRDLVDLRSLRLRWRSDGRSGPGPLELEIEGGASDSGAVDRFAERLRSHGFLGDVAAIRVHDLGARVEFELHLGSTGPNPSSSPSRRGLRTIVALSETVR